MTAGHVRICIAMFLVSSLAFHGACEPRQMNVLDKWRRHSNRSGSADEQPVFQGLSHSSHEAQNQFWIGQSSTTGSAWASSSSGSTSSSNSSSNNLLPGLLKMLGIQAGRETLNTSQEEGLIRRRSAKENTIPHIIHQVLYCHSPEPVSCLT